MLAVAGVSFLTPLDALFALAAVVPLAAFALAQRRSEQVRRALSLGAPNRRRLVPVVAGLVLLPCLLGVAAAQPVVVRQKLVSQRADAEAYFVFDTSLSMSARPAPGTATRLVRAKREALRLAASLGDIPVGIASMTDRTLPNLLPTTDPGLIRRTIQQAVGIDRPPPSQRYKNRATTLNALLTMGYTQFYPPGVEHRILVVFTDGESTEPSVNLTVGGISPDALVHPFFVHVWAPDEHIFAHGKVNPGYQTDGTSNATLQQFATLTHGRVFPETQIGSVASAIHAVAGSATAHTKVTQYARVALAPWFVLAGVVPLAFLLWRRNL